MKLYTEERFLLRKLLEEGKFNLYEIYCETLFTSGQIARFVKSYSRKFYIVKIGKNVYLTFIGRFFIKRMNLFASKEDRYWKELPVEMKILSSYEKNQVPQNLVISRRDVRKIISNKGCSRPK